MLDHKFVVNSCEEMICQIGTAYVNLGQVSAGYVRLG